jgi:hypothetical protein
MITVANITHTAARVQYAFAHKRIRIEELCDPAKILHIDSKVLDEAEAQDEPGILVCGRRCFRLTDHFRGAHRQGQPAQSASYRRA